MAMSVTVVMRKSVSMVVIVGMMMTIVAMTVGVVFRMAVIVMMLVVVVVGTHCNLLGSTLITLRCRPCGKAS